MGAYFLGGYGEDGRGMNGLSKAAIAAAKSWATGIPVSSIICQEVLSIYFLLLLGGFCECRC